jgi:hypothetical protein
MRIIHDLTTEEAYHLVADTLNESLPPLEAIENEDWGRDYVLQRLLERSPEELAALGILREPATRAEDSSQEGEGCSSGESARS